MTKTKAGAAPGLWNTETLGGSSLCLQSSDPLLSRQRRIYTLVFRRKKQAETQKLFHPRCWDYRLHQTWLHPAHVVAMLGTLCRHNAVLMCWYPHRVCRLCEDPLSIFWGCDGRRRLPPAAHPPTRAHKCIWNSEITSRASNWKWRERLTPQVPIILLCLYEFQTRSPSIADSNSTVHAWGKDRLLTQRSLCPVKYCRRFSVYLGADASCHSWSSRVTNPLTLGFWWLSRSKPKGQLSFMATGR